jgi:hypothetical protein
VVTCSFLAEMEEFRSAVVMTFEEDNGDVVVLDSAALEVAGCWPAVATEGSEEARKLKLFDVPCLMDVKTVADVVFEDTADVSEVEEAGVV